jgi:hypothetical protein
MNLNSFRYALLALILGVFPAWPTLAPLCSLETEQDYPLEWEAVQGAGSYLVEVQDFHRQPVLSRTVSTPSLTVKLLPGQYFLRLTTLNRFMKSEGASDWLPIHIYYDHPPLLSSFSPAAMMTGQSGSIRLEVATLDRTGEVWLESPSGQRFSFNAGLLADEAQTLQLPALREAGAYDLVLRNPPNRTNRIKGVLMVSYPPAEITGIEPAAFQTDRPPARLTVHGRNFLPKARVTLETNAREIDLAMIQYAADHLEFTLPPDLAPGTFPVRLYNLAGQDTVTLPVLRVLPPTPVITDLAPDAAFADLLPVLIRLHGSAFLPEITAWLEHEDSRIPLEIIEVTPDTLDLALPGTLAPGEYRLAAGNGSDSEPARPDELVFRVDEPVIVPPSEAPAPPDPQRSLLISAGWNCQIPLGSWADMYGFSARGVQIGTEIYLTPDRAHREETSFNLGLRLGLDWAGFYTDQAKSGQYRESRLDQFQLYLAPSAELALSFLKIRLAAGGGLQISVINGSGSAGTPVSRDSLDFLLAARLAAEVPIADWLRLGIGGEYRHVFMSQPFDALSLEAGVTFVLPLGESQK